jgi:NAD(P)-dependent dehydrogenase (short-subunit alcohol dehydrogenase family)
MDDLKGKVVVITGASKGLGRALAIGFAVKGSRVAICARNTDRLHAVERTIRRNGGSVFAMPLDISEHTHVARFAAETLGHFKKVDVLINNASILGPRVPFHEYPLVAWREVVEVNINGLFHICKAFLPSMINRRYGSIINLSSGVGSVGKPNWGAYLVSKFGTEGLSHMLAEELRNKNIRVNIVNPGGMATEMRQAAYPDEDQSKLKRPEDILDIFYYLASDQSATQTGQRFNAQEFSMPVL